MVVFLAVNKKLLHYGYAASLAHVCSEGRAVGRRNHVLLPFTRTTVPWRCRSSFCPLNGEGFSSCMAECRARGGADNGDTARPLTKCRRLPGRAVVATGAACLLWAGREDDDNCRRLFGRAVVATDGATSFLLAGVADDAEGDFLSLDCCWMRLPPGKAAALTDRLRWIGVDLTDAASFSTLTVAACDRPDFLRSVGRAVVLTSFW